jgi:hypothetical protein
MKREALDFARLQCVIELRKLVNANPHEPCFDAARAALAKLDAETRRSAFRVVPIGPQGAA